jgi:hypothetical protein
MFHVVCTCTLFGDTICLLTNWTYCIHIWLLTLLFSLQYLIEPCVGNDNTFLSPNHRVRFFSFTQPFTHSKFRLPNASLFSAPRHVFGVTQACSARADFPKFKVETAFWCSHGNIRSHVIRLQITPDEDTRLKCQNVGPWIQLGFAFTYKNQGSFSNYNLCHKSWKYNVL